MDLLRKCVECSEYTLQKTCSKCSGETRIAHPPKYSFADKYGVYRRKEKFPQYFQELIK